MTTFHYRNLASRLRPALWLGLVLLVVAASAGCISEKHEGDKITFTNAWWAPLLVMVGSLVAGPVGFFLREWSGRIAIGLMIICPLGILGGISLYTDYCEVDPNGFKGQMGFFGTKKFEAQFADIESISLQERRSRRSRSTYLVYQTRDGKTRDFAIGNAMTKAAFPHIIKFAEAKGVPIQ
jgi:hypothetical protein